MNKYQKAYERLSKRTFKHYKTFDEVFDDIDTLGELVDKKTAIDNPPLKFEELKEMKGKPVWNNEDKEWYLILDVYKPFVLNQYISQNATAIRMISSKGNNKLIGLNCEDILNIDDFEEGRFYRKQVEE